MAAMFPGTAKVPMRHRMANWWVCWASTTTSASARRARNNWSTWLHFDLLTGLPNRVLLADRLQLAPGSGRARQSKLAVAYIDLDGFKAINDQLATRRATTC